MAVYHLLPHFKPITIWSLMTSPDSFKTLWVTGRTVWIQVLPRRQVRRPRRKLMKEELNQECPLKIPRTVATLSTSIVPWI